MADDLWWAKVRACELAMKDRCVLCLPTDGSVYLDAFAEYIAEHEQPPVDPIMGIAKEAYARLPSTWHVDQLVALLKTVMAERGLTITASDATASVQSPGCVDAAPGRKG